jgi:hypothetical protein
MKTIPSNTTIFFAVPRSGQIEMNTGYTKETDAFLAALNNDSGSVEYARDDRGFMHLEENGKSVYSGCSLKSDDEDAKAEVMRECGTYLSRSYSNHFVTVAEVKFGDAGKAESVDGSDDDDLLKFYTDAAKKGIRIQ